MSSLRYIYVDRALQLAVCLVHGSAYGKATLKQHLCQVHGLADPTVLRSIQTLDIHELPSMCARRPHGLPPLPHLRVRTGFRCNASPACGHIGSSRRVLRRHYAQKHRRKGEKNGHVPRSDAVRVQTLAAEQPFVRYFQVVEPAQDSEPDVHDRERILAQAFPEISLWDSGFADDQYVWDDNWQILLDCEQAERDELERQERALDAQCRIDRDERF